MGTCKQEMGSRSYLVQCRSKLYPCYHQTTPEKKFENIHWESDTEAEDTSDKDEDIENPVDLGSTIANGNTASSNNK